MLRARDGWDKRRRDGLGACAPREFGTVLTSTPLPNANSTPNCR